VLNKKQELSLYLERSKPVHEGSVSFSYQSKLSQALIEEKKKQEEKIAAISRETEQKKHAAERKGG